MCINSGQWVSQLHIITNGLGIVRDISFYNAFIPVLKASFQKHPLINPKVFPGDAAFLPKADCPLNENGIPCCPKNPSPAMKREGSRAHLRCGLPTMKFVCPKTKKHCTLIYYLLGSHSLLQYWLLINSRNISIFAVWNHWLHEYTNSMAFTGSAPPFSYFLYSKSGIWCHLSLK